MSKFEVGDLVIAPMLWEGEARVTRKEALHSFPVIVEHNGMVWRFDEYGQATSSHLQPSLYHAGTKITIEEAQPVRWPWVNVYQGNSGYIFAGDSYETKREALEKINYGSPFDKSKYLFTCQLKPEETK